MRHRRVLAILLVLVTGLTRMDARGQSGNCLYCDCIYATGVLVYLNGSWSRGYWYYETKADGSPGAPALNAGAHSFFYGPLACYSLPTFQANPAVTLQRFTVNPPANLPCTPQGTIGAGYNLYYPAANNPPAGTPVGVNKALCTEGGG